MKLFKCLFFTVVMFLIFSFIGCNLFETKARMLSRPPIEDPCYICGTKPTCESPCPCVNLPIHLGGSIGHQNNKSAFFTRTNCFELRMDSSVVLNFTGGMKMHCDTLGVIKIKNSVLENNVDIKSEKSYYLSKTQEVVNDPVIILNPNDFYSENFYCDTCSANFKAEITFHPKFDSDGKPVDYKVKFEILNHKDHDHKTSGASPASGGPGYKINSSDEHAHEYIFPITICNDSSSGIPGTTGPNGTGPVGPSTETKGEKGNNKR